MTNKIEFYVKNKQHYVFALKHFFLSLAANYFLFSLQKININIIL